VVAAEDVPRQQAAPASSSALALSLSNLREESLALEAVRAALLSGDLAAARVRLDSVRARFPRGTLAQEQRQLSVEIAGRGGDATRAAAEAAAFLKDYPSSPHAVAVRRWLPSP
jgi:outer membrane protein assembly factor BamD (BamD/ComL family)